MTHKPEYFAWDSEDKDPQANIHGPINVKLGSNRKIKVHYCYYT